MKTIILKINKCELRCFKIIIPFQFCFCGNILIYNKIKDEISISECKWNNISESIGGIYLTPSLHFFFKILITI